MSVSQPSLKLDNNQLYATPLSSTRQTFSGVLWMLVGSTLVFLLIAYMNSASLPEKEEKQTSNVTFEVKKLEKPKPQKKVQPKPPARPRTVQPKLAPLQGLNSSIGGIDFGMPSFDMGNMGEVNDSILGDMSNVVMTDDTVDVPPKPAKRTAMNYPPQARKKGLTGYVVLNLLIDENGRVVNIKLLESTPPGVFDQVAMEGVQSWQFEAAVYQGQKVRVWAKQKIRFDLG